MIGLSSPVKFVLVLNKIHGVLNRMAGCYGMEKGIFTLSAKVSPVVDYNEHGVPVGERYLRLGAGSVDVKEEGLYVRFEPGFGLHVIIGSRYAHGNFGYRVEEPRDHDLCTLGIGGWETLCSLVDEYRERQNSV